LIVIKVMEFHSPLVILRGAVLTWIMIVFNETDSYRLDIKSVVKCNLLTIMVSYARYKRVDFVKYLTKPLCPIGSVLELKKASFSFKPFLFRK
jgi:hypothetical protein